MKLLFDHNLSHQLVKRLADVFPESNHIRLLGMRTADDHTIWKYAKANGFVMVTLDADFYDISLLRGHPPKLIWLRCGNCPVRDIERLLRKNASTLLAFEKDAGMGCLELHG
ncbi:MAG: DUF5615 family PIN-like protein [Verrucomicrobia bacterium]|nr:DUF5615 family PIN-like protein [Verrucomicrobiota bacterium]